MKPKAFSYYIFSILWLTGLGKRVLFIPYTWPSHARDLYKVASYIQEHHEVYLLISETLPGKEKFQEQYPGIKTLIYKAKEKDFFQMEQLDMDAFFDVISATPLKTAASTMTGPSAVFCRNMLSDTELVERIKQLKFDLMMVDTMPGTECLYVLPYKLNVPTVGYSAAHNPWLSRTPALPSFYPFMFTDTDTESDKMTFMRRLQNLWDMIHYNAFQYRPSGDDSFVSEFAPEKPFKSLFEIIPENILWFITTDPILEFPTPRMPHEIEIGGHGTNAASGEIPEKFEEFMAKNSKETIIVTFGGTGVIPRRYFDKMLDAFKQLPYGIIWKNPLIKAFDEMTPENILIVDWIPQNDLLADNRVKLFITHGGMNSQFEALYHGVPMIAMPQFGDQDYNAARAKHRGLGITINILTFTSADLVEGIKEMMNNDNYKANIKKASKIFKNRPISQKAKTTYWLNTVLEEGADHLRSHALDMPWWQYLMLDIIGFVVLIVLITIKLTIKLAKYMTSF